jgi:hypothetical protein
VSPPRRAAAPLLVAVLLSGVARGATQEPDHARLLAEDRYEEALALADARPPLERLRLRRRILHHAGDLTGALAAGREGLALAPDDLEMLLGTADVAVVLGLPRPARELCDRFAAAVRALPADAEQRAWWVAKAREYTAYADALDRDRERRERAALRARVVSAGALAAALLGLFALARARPDGRPGAREAREKVPP